MDSRQKETNFTQKVPKRMEDKESSKYVDKYKQHEMHK